MVMVRIRDKIDRERVVWQSQTSYESRDGWFGIPPYWTSYIDFFASQNNSSAVRLLVAFISAVARCWNLTFPQRTIAFRNIVQNTNFVDDVNISFCYLDSRSFFQLHTPQFLAYVCAGINMATLCQIVLCMFAGLGII